MDFVFIFVKPKTAWGHLCRGDYKIVAKVTNNIFVLADLEGVLIGNYHVKDLKLRVERQDEDEIGQNSDSSSDNQGLDPASEFSKQNNPEETTSRIILDSDLKEANPNTISNQNSQIQPVFQDNPQKKGPGRPKKNKKGKPRKTILAPQPDSSNFANTSAKQRLNSSKINSSNDVGRGDHELETSRTPNTRVTRSKAKKK